MDWLESTNLKPSARSTENRGKESRGRGREKEREEKREREREKKKNKIIAGIELISITRSAGY